MTTIKQKTTLMLTLISLAGVHLTGCTSMSSVMPKQSLTMEQIYDDSGTASQTKAASFRQMQGTTGTTEGVSENDMKSIRSEMQRPHAGPTLLNENISDKSTSQRFHKIPNPTLNLYVYPHLAGNDELPVPGYTTEFSAYDHEHYALPSDQPY